MSRPDNFKAFAALGETQEDIRKSIIEGENIISHLKFGLQDDSLEVCQLFIILVMCIIS